MTHSQTWYPAWIPALCAHATPAQSALFLSDIHLGTGPEPAQRRAMLELVLGELPREAHLVLGGDIFEFWWEWKTAVPRAHLWFLRLLETVAKRGNPITFIAGNHDFAVGSYLTEFCGAQICPDGLCLDIQQQRWLLLHGDAVAPSDRADRVVRRILRSHWAQACWNCLPPDWAMSIAGGVGAGSRKVSPGPAPNLPEYREQSLLWMQHFGLSGVIHGHTHRAWIEQTMAGTYVNNGDWLLQRTGIWVAPNGRAHLHDFQKQGLPWPSTT